MFTRKSDRGQTHDHVPPTAPALSHTRAARPTTGAASVIGPDLFINGNMETAGEVRIEGEVQGDIRANRIVVGEHATVTGALFAEEIMIGGNVQGSIRGNSVTFQSASHVEGDVYHRSLTIEQGAYFEGKSRRTENPLATQHSPGNPPPA